MLNKNNSIDSSNSRFKECKELKPIKLKNLNPFKTIKLGHWSIKLANFKELLMTKTAILMNSNHNMKN